MRHKVLCIVQKLHDRKIAVMAVMYGKESKAAHASLCLCRSQGAGTHAMRKRARAGWERAATELPGHGGVHRAIILPYE